MQKSRSVQIQVGITYVIKPVELSSTQDEAGECLHPKFDKLGQQ